MFGVDSLKEDILNYINECVEMYRDTGDKKYLYELLDFCNWLIEVSKSIVEILKSYGIPIQSKLSAEETSELIPKVIYEASLKAEPIVIEIPKIELKLPEEVKTVSTKVTTEKRETELE